MASRKWYIQYNDSVLGPFTSNQLRKMAERSQITPDVKVRVGENGAWRSASSVKGLVINSAPASDSMSSELSSEDILSPESNQDSSSSSELSSESFEDVMSKQPASSSSFGEMRSEAPPVPGEVPVRGTVPPHSEIPIPREVPPPHFSQIGEMPSPPPPVDGTDLGRAHSSGRSGRKKRSRDAIPSLIQELISPDEQILYAAHPATTVLLIQGGLTLMCYLFFGIIPSAVMMSNNNTDSGGGWLVYSTLALIIVLTIHYLRWIRSSYVITTERTFVKSGIFSVDVAYIYNANIQMLKIRTGFIDKILHLNTIELRTSAGYLSLRWTPLTDVLQFYRK
ncbi:MAG: DUF4339 domain-containing protein [Thermoguttaceae bacterium]|nr:DUF4339 domain-containing protein [Thermoguttaceae bacterium]